MRWLVIVAALTACPKSAPPAPPPPDAGVKSSSSPFWAWFAVEQGRLADQVIEHPETVMEEIQKRLAEHEPQLLAELSLGEHRLGPHGLVISADGRAELFPKVRQLVAAAPKLERWDVIAFRPRHEPSFPVEPDGSGFVPGDFTFREVGRAGGKLRLEVAIRGLTPENHQVLVRVAFMLMQAAIGEVATAERIGDVDFTPGTTKAPAPGFQPLSELAAVVEAMK